MLLNDDVFWSIGLHTLRQYDDVIMLDVIALVPEAGDAVRKMDDYITYSLCAAHTTL